MSVESTGDPRNSGPAEGGVLGVHMHSLFLVEAHKDLPYNSLLKMPFLYRGPPVFSTLRWA